MSGHLFIINGDLTEIACDAILIPTSSKLGGETWTAALGHHRSELAALRKNPREAWGSNKVIPLRRIGKEPRIWLGRIGQYGNSSDFKKFAPFVEAFVIEALARYKRSDRRNRIYDWPLPRFAVNVMGSGRGGGAEKKGELVLGMVKKLRELTDVHEVDLILVAYGDKSYAAAQRARRQLVGNDNDYALQQDWAFELQPAAKLISHARRIANGAIEKHLVLFIGAGASEGAGLPGWRGLLSEVAEEAGIESLDLLAKKDVRDQATIIEQRLSSQHATLRSVIAAKLTSRWYSLTHGLLASLPSTEAVTTNYDGLFEAAWSTANRTVAILPRYAVEANGRWLLKLHGTVDAPDTIVLTRSDYLEMPRRHGALMGLVQGLLMMRHMVFVGYSLQDEDFHELMHEVRTARGDQHLAERAGTALTLHEDPLDKDIWREDLDIVAMSRPHDLSRDQDDATRKAARQLEIFLDLIGYLATTSAAFFLDPTYDRLSGDEAGLRTILARLASRTADARPDEVAYKVKKFLHEELGADPRD